MAGTVSNTYTGGAQFEAAYDASNYATLTVSSAGDLTIAPTGGDTNITGRLAVSSNTTVGGTLAVTGAVTLSSTLAVTGVATFSGDVIASVLCRGTSDGSDTSIISLAGGGAASSTRGAHVGAYGNENATNPGLLWLVAGNVSGGKIQFNTEATDRGEMANGIFAWGTTVTTSASAGDVVLANSKAIRSVTSAGTDTRSLIRLSSDNNTQLAISGGAVLVGHSVGTGAADSDIVLANAKALRGVNAAGTDTLALVSVDSANRTYIHANSTEPNLTGWITSSTVGAAGVAAALPSNPRGYISVLINGTGPLKIPYYNA